QLSLRLYNELTMHSMTTKTVDMLERVYERLMHAASLDLKPEALSNLMSTIEGFHGSAKISGAGGGDCVLAFFDTQASYDEALEYFYHSKYPLIHLRRSQ
ncbi:MAG: hypothetical protein ACOCSM_02795, partial [Bacillota bacterium]